MKYWNCEFLCTGLTKEEADVLAEELFAMEEVSGVVSEITTHFDEKDSIEVTFETKFGCGELSNAIRKLSAKHPGLPFKTECRDHEDDSFFWREEFRDGKVRFSMGRKEYSRPTLWFLDDADKYRPKND